MPHTFSEHEVEAPSPTTPPAQHSESTRTNAVHDFVIRNNGNTPITKVLIANNGMAAVKAIRSIHKWAYETFGDERAIQFTAMCTPEDLTVNAEFVRMADQYVEVPGGTANHNYANVDLIVDIAERTGVHAVWVGWGFASENPVLAEKLAALSPPVVFVGPPPSAMRALGDKIASTIVAQSADVPCVAWSGTGIDDVAKDSEGHVYVPDEIYLKATTNDVNVGLSHAERIGYPVMIKASEGGGGKGIRLVDEPSQFAQAFVQVQREVPGSPIFIMRVVRNARHLEVQLLADGYGNAIALFGRDCSVQRRHQKILEEAPITIAPPEILSKMENAAVRLAKLVGYVSAGTVEYLYEPSTGEYYFLELNPRLQVEHPTTEMVSGVNIPAAQLQVAMGIPLSNIRDIRTLYGLTPTGRSEIDFDFSNPDSYEKQRKPSPKGHVIAARITAENPDAGFKPNSGKVVELNFRSNSNVWGYFSVNASGGVHEYADSQFGHVFSYGETRQDCRKNLVMALKELSIRGDFRTTVEYLIKLLETETYVDNKFTTGWLDVLIAQKMDTEKPDSILTAICGAVAKAQTWFQHNIGEFCRALEKGQTPSRSLLETKHQVDFILHNVQYKIAVTVTGAESYRLTANGSHVDVVAKKLADGGVMVLLGGQKHLVYAKDEGHATHLELDSKAVILEKENDPTKLRSPSPGKLVRYLVEEGSHLNAGDAFAEIEVMKMYMPLLASESGLVEFVLPAGSVLSAGEVIGSLTLDDPSKVRRATVFEGEFPKVGAPRVVGDKPHQRYEQAKQTVDGILDGYEFHGDIGAVVRHLVEQLREPEVPLCELSQVLSALAGRVPPKLGAAMQAEIERFRTQGEPFRPEIFQQLISQASLSMNKDDHTAFTATIVPVQQVLDRYAQGIKYHERAVLASLLTRYIHIQELFDSKRQDDVLLELRDQHKNALGNVVAVALAFSKQKNRNDLALVVLDHLRSDITDEGKQVYVPIITEMTAFTSRATAKVSLKARELLMWYQMPSYEERFNDMQDILLSAVKAGNACEDDAAPVLRQPSFDNMYLSKLVTANHTILDILPQFFYHSDVSLRAAALYTYVLHTYQAYSITSVKHHIETEPIVFEWEFTLRPVTTTSGSDSKSRTYSRAGSSTSLSSLQTAPASGASGDLKGARKGVLCAFTSLADVEERFASFIEQYGEAVKPAVNGLNRGSQHRAARNVVNIAVLDVQNELADTDAAQAKFKSIVASIRPLLRAKAIRRVTFMLLRKGKYPHYFTYKEELDFVEDVLIRHIEPAMAYQLELQRLANYEVKPCFIDNRRIHVYHGVGKKNPADHRFFVRAMVYPGQAPTDQTRTHEFLLSEGTRILTDIMDALEIVGAQFPNTDGNHIFVNFVPTFEIDTEVVESSLRDFVERHGQRLWKLRVTTAEVRFLLRKPITAAPSLNGSNHGVGRVSPTSAAATQNTPRAFRYVMSSVTGYVTRNDVYQEHRDGTGVQKFQSLSSPPGPLHQVPVSAPYPTRASIQPKRYKAHLMGTTYIYDFPELFRRAVEKKWVAHNKENGSASRVPAVVMNVTELVVGKDGNLIELVREPGENDCGMVAWDLELFTPEYPEGRHIVVVANDITFNIGSFGPQEDLVFFKASEYARKQGIPRIYISANSGARIGLADEVINHFNVAWLDPSNPAKGFDYLYLTEAEHKKLVLDQPENPSVHCELVTGEDGEKRYKIVDVIGREHGLGVENLQGSGMIAGETSLAYEEIFTVTLVTCRSVGIGAYLVRLGQRAIQVEYTPIILTGAAALNKVLGREVYTSNLQLGGTQIMHRNGVSHLVAKDDMNGVQEIINWLSFVPKHRNAPLPVLPTTDPIDREVETEITKAPYDPRVLLAGGEDKDGDFAAGFFDRGTFAETLAGWAKGVVVGRARLGGIPVGVISVETRSTDTVIPADAANETSQEQTISEAGGVWYPNSSYKTAQAINDFNKGEQLPLFIFANWRGFSGGQSDMYKEVLKYGAGIVDALRAYKQPVFVYVIGELRGGAWVVVDPTINPDMMEMYAEEQSRGGVLEPQGIVEIKFRRPQMIAAMERLDPEYRALKRQLAEATPDAKAHLQAAVERREKDLLPVYHQVAVEFADLHDRPGRMLAKDVVHRIVGWAESRKFFYWRLLRRISEETVIRNLQEADSTLTRADCKYLLQQWFADDVHKVRAVFDDDEMEDQDHQHQHQQANDYPGADLSVVRWLGIRRESVDERVDKVRIGARTRAVQDIAASDIDVAVEGILKAVQGLDAKHRQRVLDSLRSASM
ncbi:acetyl-CoA carboxylase [Fimicolochytrium jonesii]|uniref:acetyl-CoA carboxylase n=1 Tax=Fimicolochytrium jonesii TaxID=1396493 RepID=UPI0022FE1393|nr:acetyl-CoA carboxylase [Fimicolochytrium jonesii]KAI8815908.1 acetyl-CoA carboxylase [Fimicolochytrium jonesii]